MTSSASRVTDSPVELPAAPDDLGGDGSGRDLAVRGLVALEEPGGAELRLRRGEALFLVFFGERRGMDLPGDPGGGLCASTFAAVGLCPIQAQLERGVLSMDRE